MSDKQQQPRVRISGLWEGQMKDGQQYFSGTTGGQRWTIWPNKFHEDGSSSPTHYLFVENLPPKDKAEEF